MRVKRGFKARHRRQKVLKLAKGFRGGRSKLYRTAAGTLDRALRYAYRDRKARKRDSARFGLPASTPPCAATTFLTASSCTA